VTCDGFVDDFGDFVLKNKNLAMRQQLYDRLSWSEGEVGSGDDDRAVIAVVIEYRDAHTRSDFAEHGNICPVYVRAKPESRAAYQRLIAQGWTDSIRALHPKEPMYTFWDYKRKRWERDAGLRLDLILLSSGLRARLHSGGVDSQTRRMEGASDHAPVWVNVQDEPDQRRAPLRRAIGQTVAPTTTASP
jgi:exonuclease III